MIKLTIMKKLGVTALFLAGANSVLAATPSQEVLDTFKENCTSCHANYLRNGELDWRRVSANARNIDTRLTWEGLDQSKVMPPIGTPQNAALSAEENKENLEALRAAIKAEITVGSFSLDEIKLPEGFKISIFAEVPGARSLTLGKNNTVFVGTRGSKVYMAQDANKDGVAETVKAIASNLDTPNGVAYKDDALYIAEKSRIIKLNGVDDGIVSLRTDGEVLVSDFGSQGQHYWKYAAIGPDNKLYVPIGADCNICRITERSGQAKIHRMNLDGTGLEVFASGVRNTVGYTWHPETGEMWFTDNGRDQIFRGVRNDETPNDELNHAPTAGMHFGYPYCHYDKEVWDETSGELTQLGLPLPDPSGFNADQNCSQFTMPKVGLRPHSASLGIRFYNGDMFPESYKGKAFIAQRGSWNATVTRGSRVMEVTFDEGGNVINHKPFADGWLKNGAKRDRPVDVLVMEDGSLIISADNQGILYRVTYSR